MSKDKSLIPIGMYCYKFDHLYDGPKLDSGAIPVVPCPFDTYKELNGVSVPYCSYLEKLGWKNSWKEEEWEKLIEHFGDEDKVFEALKLDLLWDACKECGENYEEDFNIDLKTEEGKKKMQDLDDAWIKRIKSLTNFVNNK